VLIAATLTIVAAVIVINRYPVERGEVPAMVPVSEP